MIKTESTALLERCVCGSTQYDALRKFGIHIQQCADCGVMRQDVRMTKAELAEWYRDQYMQGTYSHTLAHDVAVAKTRLKAYKLTPERTRLLDVGCGNGAFVAEARAMGMDAWGQELAASSNSDVVYVGALEEIGFPTDHFDVVTLHDVLEHHPDPKALLVEIRRVLRRPGKLIVDFPRFFHESGAHHWKPIEHLWMFSEGELREMLMDCGFTVGAAQHPIPSKVVFECDKIAEPRTSILVPAGIGDAYWVLTKLPGFMRENGLVGIPDVYVQDSGGPKRTQPFLQTIPSVHAAGYKPLRNDSKLFHEAYMRDARTVFPDVLGVDYFIAYNGVMRAGKSLVDVDPQYGCEWYPRMFVSKAAMRFRDEMVAKGPYIVTYYAEAGMYTYWLAEFPEDQISYALRIMQRDLNVGVAFIGASWDRGQVGKRIAESDPTFVDLIGATTYDQMVGCLLGATAVVGYPAGNTMLGAVLGIPTVLLWNDYFDQRFWVNACPPSDIYKAVDTHGLDAQSLSNIVKGVIAARR